MSWTRKLDIFFAVFLASHIPATLIIGTQCVFPRESFPSWAQELLKWHVATNGDKLASDIQRMMLGVRKQHMHYCSTMRHHQHACDFAVMQVGENPVWFKSLMTAEVFLQLPCFLLLTYGLTAAVSVCMMPV